MLLHLASSKYYELYNRQHLVIIIELKTSLQVWGKSDNTIRASFPNTRKGTSPMAKSITHLFSVFFQSFLSIDCGKTANMIVTEFPDALTVVVRQLEVRSARLIILQLDALQITANLVTRRQKNSFILRFA